MSSEFKLSKQLLERLAGASHLMVLTGAGMSAESGIPTFRDAQEGMWAKYRPEDLATPEAFEADPARVWNWYEARRASVVAANPHAGHYAVAQLEKLLPSIRVVTQNVDGLHQAAGSTNVCELHGNILRSKCHVSHRLISREWLADSTQTPPRSPYVKHGLARPDVVWFGEVLPQAEIDSAMQSAQRCDFCFSVGTTSLVHPASSLPLMALEHGAALVEINPLETSLSMHADQCLRGKASEVLISIIDQLKGRLEDRPQS